MPERLRSRDTNLEKQRAEPQWYGPYLAEGECYQRPRTQKNFREACQEIGLEDLPEDDRGERQFYEDLVWDLWILFDDKLRAIESQNELGSKGE